LSQLSCESREVLEIFLRWSKLCGDCICRKASELSTQSLFLNDGGCNKCTSCVGEKLNVAKAIWAAFIYFVATEQLLGPLMALEGDKRGSSLANVSQSLGTSCL
jgi:hypothetical protein